MKKSDIKGITLIGHSNRTSNSYGRNLSYMRYTVLLNVDGKTVNIADVFSNEELKRDLGYWSTRSESMSMTCWGTSQLFKCQITLGNWLGFDNKNWPEFSRKCTDFIKQAN